MIDGVLKKKSLWEGFMGRGGGLSLGEGGLIVGGVCDWVGSQLRKRERMLCVYAKWMQKILISVLLFSFSPGLVLCLRRTLCVCVRKYVLRNKSES